MFRPNPGIKVLDPAKIKVYSLLTSINQPSVSVGEAPAAPSFAFICGVWNRDGSSVEVTIMLFQSQQDIAMFYTHEDGPVHIDDYWQRENAALTFTESMGFMMDNLNFQEMNEVQQHEAVIGLPPFMTNRRLYQGGRSVANEATAVMPNLVDLGVDAEVVMKTPVPPPEIPDVSFFERDEAEGSVDLALEQAPAKPANLVGLAKLLTSF